MMGGPIDTREGADRGQHASDPAAVRLVRATMSIATVPMIYPGAGRKVYPGFLQLAGFMTMNLGIAPHQPLGDVQASRRRRRGKRGGDPEVLRRISLGLRHDGRILPADRRRRVPAALAPEGRDEAPRAAGRSRRRSATPRCSRSRASATTFRVSARPRRRSTSRPSCRRRRSNISWPRTSAITASSTAASGASRSRRSSRSSIAANG